MTDIPQPRSLSHLDRLGANLGKAVDSYNSTVGTVESRLAVTARKLSEMDAFGSADPPPEPRLVSTEIRQTAAAPSPRA